jgi:hypothetical protein
MALGQMGRVTRPTRLARQLGTLGQLTVLAARTADSAWLPAGAEHVILPPRNRTLPNQLRRAAWLAARRFEREIWDESLLGARAALHGRQFDHIFCEDLTLLPLALALRDEPQNASRARVIMDAREFYPLQFEHQWVWRTFLGPLNDYLCRIYLPRADHVFTVSPGLLDAYAAKYDVACQLLPSCAPLHDLAPTRTGQRIRLIHHGGAMPGRKLEVMLETARLLDERFSLDLMLVPSDAAYLRKLKALAAAIPQARITPPVPMPEIVPFISQYDMGIFLVPPTTFNLRHCLPNKFFEFLQARLGIAIGPSPDMARMVQQYRLGIVADDFTPAAMATRLNALTPADIDAFKAAAHVAARELCWEHNETHIATLLREPVRPSHMPRPTGAPCP